MTNSTLVLALTALVSPIQVEAVEVFLVPIIYLITILVIFEVFVRTDKKLVAWEGVFLILVYVVFLLTEIGLEFFEHRLG